VAVPLALLATLGVSERTFCFFRKTLNFDRKVRDFLAKSLQFEPKVREFSSSGAKKPIDLVKREATGFRSINLEQIERVSLGKTTLGRVAVPP